jgi:Asp-tRNA(Asn)/Glu-tRNA(Gln) amidotransferase A subunit family amidase
VFVLTLRNVCWSIAGRYSEQGPHDSVTDRRVAFNQRIGALFDQYDFLLLPVAPASSLENGADHGPLRGKMLRYSGPGSVAGLPCLALPNKKGGCQLLGPSGGDAKLLAFATRLASGLSA